MIAKRWSRWWMRGWMVIFGVLLGYELYAWRDGSMATPTISTVLVATIPQEILLPGTVVVAAVLVWHWMDLKRRQDRGEDA